MALYFLGYFFRFSDGHPYPFYYEVPPGTFTRCVVINVQFEVFFHLRGENAMFIYEVARGSRGRDRILCLSP